MNIIDLAKKFHIWVSVTFNVGKGVKPVKGLPRQKSNEIQFREPTVAPVEYIDEGKNQ